MMLTSLKGEVIIKGVKSQITEFLRICRNVAINGDLPTKYLCKLTSNIDRNLKEQSKTKVSDTDTVTFMFSCKGLNQDIIDNIMMKTIPDSFVNIKTKVVLPSDTYLYDILTIIKHDYSGLISPDYRKYEFHPLGLNVDNKGKTVTS